MLFSPTNAVLVAITQVGLIVIGVLSAGASHKWWTSSGIATPPVTMMLMDYGAWALLIPLGWIFTVFQLRNRSCVSEDAKSLAFNSGFVILLILLLFIAYAVLAPWVRVDWGIGGGLDDA